MLNSTLARTKEKNERGREEKKSKLQYLLLEDAESSPPALSPQLVLASRPHYARLVLRPLPDDAAAAARQRGEPSSRKTSAISPASHSRCRRRRLPRPAAAFDSDPLAALDKAAALLNRAISFTDANNQKKKNKKGDEKDKDKPTKKRWVSFSAAATSAVAVGPLLEQAARRQAAASEKKGAEASEGGGEGGEEEARKVRIPGRGLLAYLALPASEYSLLDPTWVTREGEGEGEEESDGDENGADDSTSSSTSSTSSTEEEKESFLVRFPFADLVGIPLNPSFRVRVASRCSEKGIVAFAVDKAALGDKNLDAAFEASVDATLSKKKSKNKKVKKGGGASSLFLGVGSDGSGGSKEDKDKGLASALGGAAAAAVAAARNDRGEEEAAEEDEEAFTFVLSDDDASSSLQAHVTIKARVQLSGPAAALPGPLVSLAAKLVARAALSATLAPFLTLLVNDYWSWSLGLDRSALMKLGDDDKQVLRLQVAEATAEMEKEMERRRLKKSEEAARGEGEVIEL